MIITYILTETIFFLHFFSDKKNVKNAFLSIRRYFMFFFLLLSLFLVLVFIITAQLLDLTFFNLSCMCVCVSLVYCKRCVKFNLKLRLFSYRRLVYENFCICHFTQTQFVLLSLLSELLKSKGNIFTLAFVNDHSNNNINAVGTYKY